MNKSNLLNDGYYLNSSISFFKLNFEKRLKFLKIKIFYFQKYQVFLIIVSIIQKIFLYFLQVIH